MNLNCTLETKTNQARQSDKHEIIFTFLSIALKYTKEQLRLIKDIQSLVQFEWTGCTVSRSYSLTRGKGLFCISREIIDSEPAGEYKFIYIFFSVLKGIIIISKQRTKRECLVMYPYRYFLFPSWKQCSKVIGPLDNKRTLFSSWTAYALIWN